MYRRFVTASIASTLLTVDVLPTHRRSAFRRGPSGPTVVCSAAESAVQNSCCKAVLPLGAGYNTNVLMDDGAGTGKFLVLRGAREVAVGNVATVTFAEH